MMTNQATITVFLQVDVRRIKCTTPGLKAVMVFSNIEKIQHTVSLDSILNTSLFPKQFQLQ